MNFIASRVTNHMRSLDITPTRDNRMPVQIAGVRATGYIPQELKKRDFMKKTGEDSATLSNTKSISNQREEFLPKQRNSGETSRRWLRKDRDGRYYHRRDITDGE